MYDKNVTIFSKYLANFTFFNIVHHKIEKTIIVQSSKTLTHAFVSSRLDDLNSLLCKVPQFFTKRLQNIQNNAARVVKKQKKSCHITPLLVDLQLAARCI